MFKVSNQKLLDYLKSWLGKAADKHNITPKKAAEIQQKSFLEEVKIDEKVCTPPYILIAKQLETPKPQVFEAAVLYLISIATLEPKHKKSIVSLLNAYVEKNTHKKERINYILKIADSKKLTLGNS